MADYIVKSDEREYNSNSSGDHYTNSLESRSDLLAEKNRILIDQIVELEKQISELKLENQILQTKFRNYVVTI